MYVEEKSLDTINNIGVYKILNLKNSKIYIGSTTQSFYKRYDQHLKELLRNKHKNDYLQYSFNKHGSENFEFSIIECCENTLEREQYWIDYYNSFNKDKGYNINPFATGTPNMSKYVIEKRTRTFTKTINKALEFYIKVKNNQISLEDVPVKYLKIVKSRLSNVPWNKGLTKGTHDFSYLQNVPKTKTEGYYEGKRKAQETIRNKEGSIKVYDFKNNYIGCWQNVTDLVEFSIKNPFPVFVRNKKGGVFQNCHIHKCAKNKIKHYLGYQFRYFHDDFPLYDLTKEKIYFSRNK